MNYKRITAGEVENVFKLIGKDWMLVSAANDGKVNTMTASWGLMGVLWGKDVFTVFIRPQRYTFDFVENSDHITLSFFDESHRDALKLCGTLSGRDCDKISKANLTVVDGDTETPYFAEARLVIKGKKLYGDFLKEGCFTSADPLSNYKAGDFHKMYVCEIEEILIAE